ncbi:hypothetical protein KEM55_006702, partial [Ascosphaera atra]
LEKEIVELKSLLKKPDLPFGVDLALPQVGGNARKTNHDYTHGRLDELVEVIIEHGTRLFVCAIGVPPERAIRKFHEAGILIMNMVGAPKHAEKALRAGVDIVCAQGSEGGGHTGDVPFSILIPAVVDIAQRYTSPLTGKPAMAVAAGGVNDGRSLASALMLGAQAVWVGTRFVASLESGASDAHREAVVNATFGQTKRTLAVSGRPLRVLPNKWTEGWRRRPDEMRQLVEQGVVPIYKDLDDGVEIDLPFLMGDVSAMVKEIKPAEVIVHEMVEQAVKMINLVQSYLGPRGKL